MALRIDIRRFSSLALALLIAVAVVGPACLMAASSAMAMTMPSSASSLCDSDPATMCPYEHPDANFNVAQVPLFEVAVTWLSAPGADVPTELGMALTLAPAWPEVPVSHLTPLRI